MKKRIVLLAGGVIILLELYFIFLLPSGNKPKTQELIPIDSITHGHGLSVDVEDPNKLYIATHHGLLLLKNDKELFQVGDKNDDYMGFSPHPTDPKILFASGHPQGGGNIGFQKSEDGGFSWEKVSDGVAGPVDFHALAVSSANPDLIFGWYQGALQRSSDGGKNWEIVSNSDFPIVGLAADPADENVVYGVSPQGLMVSNNKGKDWSSLIDGYVSAIAINPKDSQNLISFSEKYQLANSSDGGKSWDKVNADFLGETPLYISFSREQPEVVYLLTEKNSIYKSLDGGNSWNKVR